MKCILINYQNNKSAAWKFIFIVFLIFFFLSNLSFSQVFTNKEVGKKNQVLSDSIKKSEYPYVLPIMGAQATARGFSLPYSAGLSVQYFWQKSDLIIDNLQVGFNNGQMYNMDEIIRFDKAVATASATTFRPDVWLLPFLDVYAILGHASASTEVGYGMWLPDTSGVSKEIFSSGTVIEFSTTTFGFGFTPTIGVGGGFLALDMNFSWTDVPQLDKPANAFVFGPRLGKSFKLKKPERNIAFWAGGFRVHLSAQTSGSINLSDALSISEMQDKVDYGLQQVDETQQEVDTWWTNLSTIEQNNPVNIAKYNTYNVALEKAGGVLSTAESALNSAETATVQYAMDKRPKDMWNFIIGTQFQLNKHWMLRAEYGFLTSRTQFITGLQYRFGL